MNEKGQLMVVYSIKMKHSDESFTALAHMQYNLFCRRNLFFRSLIAFAALCAGVAFIGNWWAYLLIAYGAFLLTGKYNSANRTARQLSENLKKSKMPYPSSRIDFTDDKGIIITPLPVKSGEEPQHLSYSSVERLGEDLTWFYIFRDTYGGYMVPKEQVSGEKETAFRRFVESKTGQKFHRRTTPFTRLMDAIRKKQNEPEHL